MNEASKKYSISLEEVKMIVAAKINESGIPKGIFDDLGNSKALSSWMNDTKPQKYRIKTKEPIDIIISGDAQLAKFKILFRQHDIDFSSYEISK